MMALNDSLAAKALPWHWDQRRQKTSEPCSWNLHQVEISRDKYRLSIIWWIMFHTADLYLWSSLIHETFFFPRRLGLLWMGEFSTLFLTPGKSRWALLHRNWKRSDTTWGMEKPWHRWFFCIEKAIEKPIDGIFNQHNFVGWARPSFDIFFVVAVATYHWQNCRFLFFDQLSWLMIRGVITGDASPKKGDYIILIYIYISEYIRIYQNRSWIPWIPCIGMGQPTWCGSSVFGSCSEAPVLIQASRDVGIQNWRQILNGGLMVV